MPKLKTLYWLPLGATADFACVSNLVAATEIYKKLKTIALNIIKLTPEDLLARSSALSNNDILFISPATEKTMTKVIASIKQTKAKIYIAPDDFDVNRIRTLVKGIKNVTILFSNVDNFIGDHVFRLIDTLICEDVRVKLDCIRLRGNKHIQYLKNHIADFTKYGRIVAREFNAKPLDGSISLRVKEGFLITASKTDKANIREKDLVLVTKVNYSKNKVWYYGERLPSSETLLHSKIYEEFKNINTVVHPHWKLATYNTKLENVRTKRFIPYGTLELAEETIKVLRKSDFVTMRHHGEIVIAKNLKEAIERLREMKELLL